MSPVFKKLTLDLSQPIERLHMIRAKARECGNIMSADEHVHRIDLECVQLSRELAETVDRPSWFRIEPLGCEGETAGLGY